MTDDRREFKRFDTLLIVDIKPHSEPSSFFFGITKNISFEGFIFESQNFNLRSKDILEFTLKHPRKDISLTAVGEIIWTKKTKYEYLAGVRYRGIDEELKSRITDLVSAEADIETEKDGAEKDTQAVAPKTIDSTVLRDQPEATEEGFISDTISRLQENIKPVTLAGGSPSILKDPATPDSAQEVTKAEIDSTASTDDFGDHDDKSKIDQAEKKEETTSDFFRMLDEERFEQKKKRPVLKTSVLIAAITAGASLAIVFWNTGLKVDFSGLRSPAEMVMKDRQDDPEMNMPVPQHAPDAGLSDISQESRPLSLPEEDAESVQEQEPSTAPQYQLTAEHNDRFLEIAGTGESSGSTSAGSRNGGSDILAAAKSDPVPAPTVLKSIDETRTENSVRTENIRSQPEAPESALPASSSQKAASRKSAVAVPKKKTGPLESSDHTGTDREDHAMRNLAADDEIASPEKTDQEVVATEAPVETREQTNKKAQENGVEDDAKKERIIQYSAKPKSFFLQIGAWRNPDLAKQTLSEIRQDYAEAYSFAKDRFEVVVIPNIISKSRGTAISNEIEKKFGLKPLLTEMENDLEIDLHMAGEEIPESHIVDRSLSRTDVTVSDPATYTVIVTKPPTTSEPEMTADTEPAPRNKKPMIDSDMTPADRQLKVALTVRKTDTPSNRESSPPEKGFIRYDDFFDDNSNHWDMFELGEASARIANGFYRIENKKNEGKLIILHYHAFPHDADFKIEIVMKVIHVADHSSYGVVFGAADAFDNYSFQINDSGRYAVLRNRGNSSDELVGGRVDGLSSDNRSLSVLKIEKRGNDMSFYINDRYQDQVRGLTFVGNKIGFVLEGSSIIAIDRTSSYIKRE